MHHTSHFTRHTSHVARHTSHVTHRFIFFFLRRTLLLADVLGATHLVVLYLIPHLTYFSSELHAFITMRILESESGGNYSMLEVRVGAEGGSQVPVEQLKTMQAAGQLRWHTLCITRLV